MDSDDESYSGSGDSSSSDSSGDSSEPEQERLEFVRINGTSLELPQDLCEDPNIFKEFFSVKTWNSLSEDNQQHLKSFLPSFTENDEEEKEETLQRLFAREDFNFGSPLLTFQSNLRQGNFRPDIAKMKKVLLKARDKQQKHKLRSYYARILPEVLLGRERVLIAAKATPPGPPPKLPPLPPLPSPRDNQRPPHVRAKLRYFQELAAIRSEVGGEEQPSEDENFPEGPPSQMSRRQRRHLSALQSGLGVWWGVVGTLGGGGEGRFPPAPAADWLRNVLAAHRLRRIRAEEHPELDTSGLSLADIKQRVPLVNGHRRQTNSYAVPRHTEQPQPRAKRVKKENVVPDKPIKREHKQTLSRNGKSTDYDSTNEGFELKHSVLNTSVKSERSDSEDNSDDSSYVDPVESPKSAKKFKANVELSTVKEDVPEKKSRPGSRVMPSIDKMFGETLSVKTEQPDTCTLPSTFSQAVPIKLEDLEGINMMELPVELADVPPAEETRDAGLVARTHASFFSLLRELFPAQGGHRASRTALGARLAAHARSPIAPLNTWYSLVDDWNSVLSSALEFLAGESRHQPEDFVPYLQFMPQLQVYQWIGAGRDCDALLAPLCQFWLEHRRAPPSPPPAPPPTLPVVAPAAPTERVPTPPPRWPTTWVVRPATAAELAEFRAQERRRYASPARAFTYTQHGYRAAVAPLRGAGGGGATRGHAVLAATRPRHVTLLALVRDAVARLPNGEGTRADIATLLKMSQWVVPGAGGEAALGGAVSGALDRLHAQRADPAVRYAPQRKLWIYLHRDRTEEEFERLYAATASQSKSRATRPRAGRVPRALAAPAPVPPSPPTHVEPVMDSDPAMEVEVGCEEEVVGGEQEDSDVDVDDSGPQAGLTSAAVNATPVTGLVAPPASGGSVQLIQHSKAQQTARSLLLRPANASSVASSMSHSTSVSQAVNTSGGGVRRGGVVRVLSPAAPGAGGKSLISPRAFLPSTQVGVSLSARSPNVTTVVTARRRVPNVVTSNVATSIVTVTTDVPASLTNVQTSTTTVRPTHSLHSVQLGNQTVQLSTGQAVQLSSGHAVQLSSGQAVQLTSGHAVQLSSGQAVQLSTGQAVQISGNASGPTVQLPSGQTVQLPSGQTVQLSSGQTVQLPSGQTVQLPSGQTVQLPGGQTVQLPSGQTVQLSSGQTVQLASGQTVQLGARAGGTQLLALRQTTPRAVAAPDKPVQPLVAKLLTNAQGQIISVEGVMGRGRTLQLSAPLLQLQRRAPPATAASSAAPQPAIQVRTGGVAGISSASGAGVVRVLSPALARLAGKPVLLASKPLHNILLQQADGTTVRPAVSVAASGAQQTLVLGNIGGQAVRSAGNATPTLKLQQVNPRGTLQHVKLAPGVKLHQGTSAATGGTQVLQLASGQQLKVVGGAAGRHVLARLLRPAAPTQPPQ